MLFSDIEGFTALTERLPPREVVALLNEYFEAMTNVVVAHGGVVDKYIGDAMLVIWESEPRLGAAQASLAALGMRHALSELQLRWLAEGKLPLKCRMGIASGRVIIGRIGSVVRSDRAVIGDAVNTAARLEALNKVYFTDIILAATTRELLDDRARVRSLGIVPIKGRLEPMGIFALLGWEHGDA